MHGPLTTTRAGPSYAGAVTAVEATNPTMCDGDHMVPGGANVGVVTTAQSGRHPPSPDTPTPPGSQEPTVEATPVEAPAAWTGRGLFLWR